ncbi:MAG: hypothetical protein Q4P33_07725 [Flaviflexus sp.]|nr:hypothetical protein [Flaviflexus sp.]
MVSFELPQWLVPSYLRSAQAVGATADDKQIEAACLALLERWNSPERHHHDVRHLADMLKRLGTLAGETHHPDMVNLAAFYHGAVFSTSRRDTYTRNGGEDEVASAALARTELEALGIPEENIDRICDLITGMKIRSRKGGEDCEKTTTSMEAIDIDLLALCDAHLGSLAANPQRYAKYLDEIAEEYGHIPKMAFFRARRKIVRRLLDRRRLFASPLGRQWENQARENLQAELERLERKIDQLTEEISTEDIEAAEELTSADSVPSASTPDGPLTPKEYRRLRERKEREKADESEAPQEDPQDVEVEKAPVRGGEDTEPRPRPARPSAMSPEDSTDTKSSLEALPEETSAPIPTRKMTPEEKKKAERDEIARQMQERIERRQAGQVSPAHPRTADTPAPSTSTLTPETPTPPSPASPESAPSEETPEWIDEDDIAAEEPRAGIEAEPEF